MIWTNITSRSMSGYSPKGMEYKDGYLWINNSGTNVLKLDPDTLTIVDTISFPGTHGNFGLAWDGEKWWTSNTTVCHRLNEDFSFRDTISTQTSSYEGGPGQDYTFDPATNSIWTANMVLGENFYQLNKSTGAVIAGGFPEGVDPTFLCWVPFGNYGSLVIGRGLNPPIQYELGTKLAISALTSGYTGGQGGSDAVGVCWKNDEDDDTTILYYVDRPGTLYKVLVDHYPLTTAQWRGRMGATYPKREHKARFVGSELIMTGGYTLSRIPGDDYAGSPGASMNQTQAFDVFGEFWTEGANMPGHRYAHAACVQDDNYYVFGGKNESSVDQSQTWKYDRAADAWTTLTSMPIALSDHSATSDGQYIYILGGTGDPVSFTWHDTFDRMADTGTTLDNLIDSRSSSGILWQGHQGGFIISNSMFTTNNSTPSIATFGSWTADADMTATFVKGHANAIGFVARYQNSSNYIMIRTDSVIKRVAASQTTLATYGGFVSGGTMRCVLSGSNIKVYIGATLVADVTDSALLGNNRHGVYHQGSALANGISEFSITMTSPDSTRLFRYDPALDTYSELSSLPYFKEKAGLAYFNGRLISMSGKNAAGSTIMYMGDYVIADDEWRFFYDPQAFIERPFLDVVVDDAGFAHQIGDGWFGDQRTDVSIFPWFTYLDTPRHFQTWREGSGDILKTPYGNFFWMIGGYPITLPQSSYGNPANHTFSPGVPFGLQLISTKLWTIGAINI